MDAKNIYFKIGMEEPSKFTLYFFFTYYIYLLQAICNENIHDSID